MPYDNYIFLTRRKIYLNVQKTNKNQMGIVIKKKEKEGKYNISFKRRDKNNLGQLRN